MALNHADNARLIAQKIVGALTITMWLDDHEIPVTASIGVAVYEQEELTVSQLIERADKALYRAKHAGRNTFAIFEPDAPASALRSGEAS
jgi:diguanylate cyclase (GGDEF)-like protein